MNLTSGCNRCDWTLLKTLKRIFILVLNAVMKLQRLWTSDTAVHVFPVDWMSVWIDISAPLEEDSSIWPDVSQEQEWMKTKYTWFSKHTDSLSCQSNSFIRVQRVVDRKKWLQARGDSLRGVKMYHAYYLFCHRPKSVGVNTNWGCVSVTGYHLLEGSAVLKWKLVLWHLFLFT